MAAGLAFLLALAVAGLHTWSAYLYFQPDLSDLRAVFFPWGPHFLPEWGRHLVRVAAAALFFLSLPGLGGGLLGPWKERFKDPFLRSALALVLWSTLGFLLAAAHLSRPAVIRPLSVGLVALGLALG